MFIATLHVLKEIIVIKINALLHLEEQDFNNKLLNLLFLYLFTVGFQSV